jgi:hypothetical protein
LQQCFNTVESHHDRCHHRRLIAPGPTLTIGENSFWKPYFSDSWKTSLNNSDGSIFSDGCKTSHFLAWFVKTFAFCMAQPVENSVEMTEASYLVMFPNHQ